MSQMNFDTTLNTTIDNSNMFHPSMFQNPQMDQTVLDDIDGMRNMNPTDLWQKQVCARTAGQYAANDRSQFTVRFDPKDLPFSRAEIESFKVRLEPLMQNTLNNQQPSLLFYFFFSKANVETLQKNIRFTVNKWSGHHVGAQSEADLLLLMERVFSENAKHMDEKRAPTRILLRYIQAEVSRLNEFVINIAVPDVVDGVEQHLAFLKQMETPRSAMSLQRPMDTRVTGTTQYRSPTDILSMKN